MTATSPVKIAAKLEKKTIMAARKEKEKVSLKVQIENDLMDSGSGSSESDNDSGSEPEASLKKAVSYAKKNPVQKSTKPHQESSDSSSEDEAAKSVKKPVTSKSRESKKDSGAETRVMMMSEDLPTSGHKMGESQETRRRHFGESSENLFTDEMIAQLYQTLGISKVEAENEAKGIRLEAINLTGVDDLSTQQVVVYFSEFPPSSIEWIDNSSCNVMWLDKVTATKALLKLSRDHDENENKSGRTTALTANRTENAEKMDDDDELNLLEDEDIAKLKHTTSTIDCQTNSSSKKQSRSDITEMDVDNDDGLGAIKKKLIVPIQFDSLPSRPARCRVGVLCSGTSKTLYLRFATKADRKMPVVGKRNQYYNRSAFKSNYGNGSGGNDSDYTRNRRTITNRWENATSREAVKRPAWRREPSVAVEEVESFDDHLRRELERVRGAASEQRGGRKGRETVRYDDLSGDELEASNPPSPDIQSRLADRTPYEDRKKEEEEEDEELKQLLYPKEKKKKMMMYADSEAKPVPASLRLGKHKKIQSTNTKSRLGIRVADLHGTTDLRIRLGAGRVEQPGRPVDDVILNDDNEDDDYNEIEPAPELFSIKSQPKLRIEVLND